jgi:5'-nucleotidase
VTWDHTKPAMQRVLSINLVKPPLDGGIDDLDDPEEMVDFVEQEDGTRVEVKQRRIILGDPVGREEGGRMYRIVSIGEGSIAD